MCRPTRDSLQVKHFYNPAKLFWLIGCAMGTRGTSAAATHQGDYQQVLSVLYHHSHCIGRSRHHYRYLKRLLKYSCAPIARARVRCRRVLSVARQQVIAFEKVRHTLLARRCDSPQIVVGRSANANMRVLSNIKCEFDRAALHFWELLSA